MPRKIFGKSKLVLDARPDRVDYRDLSYRAPLVSLPKCFPECDFRESGYAKHVHGNNLILDQGKEGACTGFGLAAAVHRVLWEYDRKIAVNTGRVSAAMLYHMAKMYDEWQGEDYEGSSCRGAMKGWHHHGVCGDTLWEYVPLKFREPKSGWEQDAASRPLGAYYRVDTDSIADMQAAVREVGAVYVSASVHSGWDAWEQDGLTPLEIVRGEKGGHAFALVGYTVEGFIVQNSWGPEWGCKGFAVMRYEDWVENGSDAWVAVMGAPVAIRASTNTIRSTKSLRALVAEEARLATRFATSAGGATDASSSPAPLSEENAYKHTVVLGNDGRPLNRFLYLKDGARAVEEATRTLPTDWLRKQEVPRLAIYAHGGLNKEASSITRIRVMAPYFLENGIYPLFLTWRTGPFESIRWMLEDAIEKFVSPARAGFGLEWLAEQAQEAKDRVIESISRQLLVKSVWSQMKQNASASIRDGGGIALLVKELTALKDSIQGLEVHLIGHSAGAILLGHLLEHMSGGSLNVSTCTLYAPACTVTFANEHYAPAVKSGILTKDAIRCDVLTDERERADTAGPYGKSLLYLVSRALETVHKMPILGMQVAWEDVKGVEDVWNKQYKDDVDSWRSFARGVDMLKVHGKKDGHEPAMVNDGVEMIPLAHGSFDNNIDVVETTLRRINRGADLPEEVTNLHGF